MTGGRLCSIPDCGRRHHGHDLCAAHLSRLHRGSDLTTPIGDLHGMHDGAKACPDDLLPLVAKVVDIDAGLLFRVCWRWLGEQHLSRMEQAS